MRVGFGAVPTGAPANTVSLFRFGEEPGSPWGGCRPIFYRGPYITLAALAQGATYIALGLRVTNPPRPPPGYERARRRNSG